MIGRRCIKDDASVRTLELVKILLNERIHLAREVKIGDSRRELAALLLCCRRLEELITESG